MSTVKKQKSAKSTTAETVKKTSDTKNTGHKKPAKSPGKNGPESPTTEANPGG